MNRIYWGDNLQVMAHLLKEFRRGISLIYLDPPFASKADYKKEIKARGKDVATDSSCFEEKQYEDMWVSDQYLQIMYERLILMKELLTDEGSIFLHCDWHKAHQLRCIMDDIFGPENFINEIIWCYHGPGSPGMRQFNRKHDNIFWYGKSKKWTFNDSVIRIPHDEKTSDNFKSGLKGSGFIGDNYEIPEGKIPEDWWQFAIAARYPKDGLKRVGYPTEKPFTLLDRIIATASSPKDIVFDPFMGSGVTQMCALNAGRRFIGADINLGAIQSTTKRLLLASEAITRKSKQTELESKKGLSYFTGFSIFNVNHYDVFRNPAQAKDLIIQALEIQPLPSNALYDGEKDGRMVKIMPINRIATKADINDLLSGFDYKAFQKRREQSPSKPVESLLLVCMGHEPDLAAHLKRECQGFDLDVEIVDILRDKANLEFKRDSQAAIAIEKCVLKITAFYPMNLLQKLSLMKENVGDWRELTESVMIDWNYDGAVFEPKLVDVPEKDELVKGEYPMPSDAGTIRVKITDLLSESLETEVPRG